MYLQMPHEDIQVWHQMDLVDPARWTHDIHKYAYPGETTTMWRIEQENNR